MKENRWYADVRLWIAIGAGVVAGLLIALLRGLGGSQTPGQNAALISDGFFVTGALMGGVGALLAISGKTDFFDMLSYGVKSLGVMFTPFKKPENHPRFYEYKMQRKEKRKAPPMFILYAGLALIVLAALCLPFCSD